jgi:uncharacterized protein (DUF1697 family)
VNGRWVAFLRAINTGNRRVTGDRLVAVFESLGYERASSFQASGNILFSGDGPDTAGIEQALEAALGYPVPIALRSEQDLRRAASVHPFEQGEVDATEGRIQLILLRDRLSHEILLSACSDAPDEDLLRPHERDLFWLPRAGVSGSTLDLGALERRLGPVTVRTHNTIRRLADRL